MKIAGFEWDQGNLRKVQKHGLTLNEIETFFRQKLFVIDDARHSEYEKRWIAVGYSEQNQKPMFVSYTLRKKKIRVISARYMHEKEAREFEIFQKNSKKD